MAISLKKYAGYFHGFHATEIYLPVSLITDAVRNFSRVLRNKKDVHKQKTNLPVMPWKSIFHQKPICLQESRKNDGGVRFSELGVLCRFARHLSPRSQIFEIGTFDGRTTFNLALNAPGCRVATLDLPAKNQTLFATEPGERHFIEKEGSGQIFLKNAQRFPDAVERITQLYGDSAQFDFTPYEGKCDLVFVDGSHAHEYVINDTKTAFRLIKNTGTIIWHDYGVWPGVTRALEEIEGKKKLGLKNIQGTSLVVWKASGRDAITFP